MFQFRRFPAYAYFVQRTLTEYCSAGFPHSEIPGSKPMCGSPRLIAACHVLLRLSMPRHSPCALSSLTSSGRIPYRSFLHKCKNSLISSPLLSKSNPLRWVSIWYRPPMSVSLKSPGSQELCRLQIRFIVVCVTLLISKKSTNFTLLPLCCLLAISCLLHCSVFKVQASNLFQGQIEMLGPLPKHFNPILVEISGIEPLASCLQGRRSPS